MASFHKNKALLAKREMLFGFFLHRAKGLSGSAEFRRRGQQLAVQRLFSHRVCLPNPWTELDFPALSRSGGQEFPLGGGIIPRSEVISPFQQEKDPPVSAFEKVPPVCFLARR